jgi:hypothetical protein
MFYSDINPLFVNKLEVKPQFGRGFIGGIDQKEQLKKYKESLKQREKKV